MLPTEVLHHGERGLPTRRRGQSVCKLAEEVIFPGADHADMGIASADQAGLIGVGSELRIQLQSQLQCRADVQDQSFESTDPPQFLAQAYHHDDAGNNPH